MNFGAIVPTPRWCFVGWAAILVLHATIALVTRSDPAGEAMVAGCLFVTTQVPMLLLSLLSGARALKSWNRLRPSARCEALAVLIVGVPVLLLTAWIWEVTGTV